MAILKFTRRKVVFVMMIRIAFDIFHDRNKNDFLVHNNE